MEADYAVLGLSAALSPARVAAEPIAGALRDHDRYRDVAERTDDRDRRADRLPAATGHGQGSPVPAAGGRGRAGQCGGPAVALREAAADRAGRAVPGDHGRDPAPGRRNQCCRTRRRPARPGAAGTTATSRSRQSRCHPPAPSKIPSPQATTRTRSARRRTTTTKWRAPCPDRASVGAH